MVKRQLYSENFVDSLMTEIDLLERILNEIHDDKEKKSYYQKQIREKIKYLNYLTN